MRTAPVQQHWILDLLTKHRANDAAHETRHSTNVGDALKEDGLAEALPQSRGPRRDLVGAFATADGDHRNFVTREVKRVVRSELVRQLELGCGNGSLMVHLADWHPASLVGVDLGDSVRSARENLRQSGHHEARVLQADLSAFRGEGADLVYCIGVLHHLQDPHAGFLSVLRNTRPGGRFHCWVYAREGNGLVIRLVDPLRRILCHCPWWFTKYLAATPLAVPFLLYARFLRAVRKLGRRPRLAALPLYDYCQWISSREFSFFRHVAFDQLVTPRTVYLPRATIETWLRDPMIEAGSTYLEMRNGNSWKFGGRRRAGPQGRDAGQP